jgi:hypothetical protein
VTTPRLRPRRVISVGSGIVLTGLALFACSGSARNGTNGPATNASGVPADTAVAAPSAPAAIPVVSILSRFDVLAVYEIRPVHADRADYSGITVRSEDSTGVVIWLADDKAVKLEDAIYRLRLDLPAERGDGATPLTPERIRVRNEAGVPTGDDIEDLAWIPAAGGAPGLLAAVGERGARDQPVSWYYLLTEADSDLRLDRVGVASPPGETVGNDGMEGVAVRRSGDAPGAVEMYMFKERPRPVYTALVRLARDSTGYTAEPGAGAPHQLVQDDLSTQSGAAFSTSGRDLYVIDRQRRMVAVVSVAASGPGLEPRPREWIEYSEIDSLLEGNESDTPPSLFGVAEGIAEDAAGRLYLLADNNEVRNSRLVVLERRKR